MSRTRFFVGYLTGENWLESRLATNVGPNGSYVIPSLSLPGRANQQPTMLLLHTGFLVTVNRVNKYHKSKWNQRISDFPSLSLQKITVACAVHSSRALTTFAFFFLKEPYWLAHQQCFGTLGMPPNRSTSLDPQLQNRNKCAPLAFTFLVYIQGSWDLGKPCGIKPRSY